MQHGIESVRKKFPKLPSGHARTIVYSGLPKPKLRLSNVDCIGKDELILRIWEFDAETPPDFEEEYEEVKMEVYTFGHVCPRCEGSRHIDAFSIQNPFTSMTKPPKWPDNNKCSSCCGKKITEEVEKRLTLLRATPSNGRKLLLMLDQVENFEDFLNCVDVQGDV
jgi:hypothetical protein